MPTGSMVLTSLYWMVPSGLRRSSAVSLHSDFGSSPTVGPDATYPAAVPARLLIWNLQSAVANTSALRVFAFVLRMIISANELPSSWVRRFMPGVRRR